jgi:hypothetical protein
MKTLEEQIAELKEELLVHNSREKCTQCGHSWNPSIVESGWCIFCIQEDTKKQLDWTKLVLADTKQSLQELYNHQQRISSPDTRWELGVYQRARAALELKLL